ncbi:MAG: galactokinase [Verrucomicrobiales bacterium]|nr:galactokinase [Verrucomicrobiales bacterium]
MKQERASQGFFEAFHRHHTVLTRAPGRVNLIGEHTDYNDGFVLPAAIEFETWAAAAPRTDRQVRLVAGNRGEHAEFDLDHATHPGTRHWSDYIRGIAVELERDGYRLPGAEIWFAGSIPEGAGLSSSAALEMSVGMAFLHLAGVTPDRARLARAGQLAEHHFAGTRCGIMDQFVSAHAQSDHAILLDCRSLAYRHIPLPESLRLVICNSGVTHELASSEYNKRREQCEAGVTQLRTTLPGIRALRDVTPEQLQHLGARLDPVVLQRCRHVITENARVESFAQALAQHDLAAVGRLMEESHHSLRNDYEVSCNELDALVQFAQAAPGCVGARMTGGGFGGSTINLVQEQHVEAFKEFVEGGFERAVGTTPRIHITRAAAGASCVTTLPA